MFSRATQSLTKYLLSQRPVTLASSEGGQEAITHMIIQQGQYMYLHQLNPEFQFPEKGHDLFTSFYGQGALPPGADTFLQIVSSAMLSPPGTGTLLKKRKRVEESGFVTFTLEGIDECVMTSPRLVEGTMDFTLNYVGILAQSHLSNELNQYIGLLKRLLTTVSTP